MTLSQVGVLLGEIKAAVTGTPALAQELTEAKALAADYSAKLKVASDEVTKLKADLAAKVSDVDAAKAEAASKAAEALVAVTAKEQAEAKAKKLLSLIHISEPTRPCGTSRMPSSA